MKITKALWLIPYPLLFTFAVKSQDTLSKESLKSLTYNFTIAATKLSGDGANLLREEIANAQFTILGDYSNSKSISKFTRVILPELNQLNYRTMALDVGPVSTRILAQLPLCNKDITSAIKTLNDQYGFKEEDRTHFPMPSLSSVEEANYVGDAIHQHWNLIGLNNDSWNSLKMLLNELHFNLIDENKNEDLYNSAIQELASLYQERNGDLLSFVKAFRNKTSLQDFLNLASTSRKNKGIIESINYSLIKSQQYAQKAYFAKNRDRIPYEKQLLREQLNAIDFDISRDKLFVKVNRRHASKGFQPDGFYGFSNTLFELAEFHGNKSIHIGFFRRFYIEAGQLKDEMDNNYYVRNRYKDIIQMGQQDKWTLIDLRPLMEGSYYSGKYTLTPWIQELMKQYDLIIIPPTDYPLTPNHSLVLDKD